MEKRRRSAFRGLYLFAGLCVLGLPLSAHAAGANAPAITAKNSKLPLEKEFERAQQLGRPVLVFLHTEWCEPCHRFIRELLPLPEVQALSGKVHWVTYDGDWGPGRTVVARLGVRSYPSFILFAHDGTICRRIPGFIPEATLFLEQIESMLPLARSEAEVKAELAGPMPGAASRFGAGRWYALRSRFDEALAQLDEAARLGEQAETASEDVAAAVWLGAKLRRAREVCNYRAGNPECRARGGDLPAWRRHLVDDGVALVRRYPGTRAAADALKLAVLSGLLGAAERDELLGLVREAAKGNGQLVLLALAAHAYDEALLLGQRGVKLAPRDVWALLYLAEVYHYRGERAQALLMNDKARQIDMAEGGGKRATTIERYRQRYENAGKKGGDPSPLVELMRRQVSEQLGVPGLDPERDL